MMNSVSIMRTSSRGFLFQGLRLVFLAIGAGSVCVLGQSVRISADRGTATVLVEPYAPNIVRVSISSINSDALAAEQTRSSLVHLESRLRRSSSIITALFRRSDFFLVPPGHLVAL